MSSVSVTFRNIYIKFQLFQINVAHCVQKMSNLTQLTASLTSKYNLHHAFGHAPRPQIILKLKATIFKENISNSNGVDTTSNNFSDNILTNKRIKFNHMTPPCRERGTKHPRTTHHCLHGSHHPSSSDRESSFSWKDYMKGTSREWVHHRSQTGGSGSSPFRQWVS